MPKSKSISFKNSSNHELAANIELPDSASKNTKYALFAHCFGCSKDVLAASRISKALAKKGFGVMRFDFTGLGSSDGEFSETNFSSNIQDLKDAANFLAKEYSAPSMLIGHSLGGAAVLAAAEEIASINAIVTIGAPSNAIHVSHIFENKRPEIFAKGHSKIKIGMKDITITKQFVADLATHDFDKILNNLQKPLLVMHAPEDTVVEISEAANIYKAANHPKSFICLDKADHLLTDKQDSEYAATIIAAWALRYVY